MTLHCTAMAKRLLALTASAGLLLTMTCSTSGDDVSSTTSSSTSASSTTEDGNVVIFAPRTASPSRSKLLEQMGKTVAGDCILLEIKGVSGGTSPSKPLRAWISKARTYRITW